jgi:hypothetical protein
MISFRYCLGRLGAGLADKLSALRFSQQWIASRPARAALTAIAFIVSAALAGTFVQAQQPPASGILASGNAAVTGFSGALPPTTIKPGVDPADKTYIDVNGPAARVIDLSTPGAPPQAQLIAAPKPFTATAAQIGQVFAVALDNASPPNIYVAASSAYGLPIVVPDRDGDGLPDRVKRGAPNASFMPGLFGPLQAGGGPGSVWRIDGASGQVSRFANVTLDGAPNAGPALGGLAFDPSSQSLFVADRATGMIQRFDPSGAERGRYDHGAQGRAAAGLAPVPYDPAGRLDITNPKFDSENPGTWGYTARPRLIFGLAVHAGRLFYAVADGLQIWSVAIGADGAFGGDPRLEITVPPSQGATEISKITFDDQGRMLLAERAAPTGAYDFAALAQEGVGRVLRYAPDLTGGQGWQPAPDEYAIGFPLQMRNGNGGVAVGNGYDSQGRIDRNSCGGFLWSTGEQLRKSPDPALAARLAQGGPAEVNGLQGNDINLVVPANVPPLTTYFADYDERYHDPAARGHVGDIAIWTICGRASLGFQRLPWLVRIPGFMRFRLGGGPLFPPPPPLQCPPGSGNQCACPVGTTQQPGFQCCPLGMFPGPNGMCQSLCPNGASDELNIILCMGGFSPVDPANPPQTQQDFGNLMCVDGSKPVPDGSGGFQCPMPMFPSCPAGSTPDPSASGGCKISQQFGDCLMNSQGGGLQQPGLDGSCQQLCPSGGWGFPANQCCPVGTMPGPNGQCMPPAPPCLPGQICFEQQLPCPPGQVSSTGTCCPPGTTPLPGGACGALQIQGGCPPNMITLPGGACGQPQLPCPPSQVNSSGTCCPPGQTSVNGQCQPPPIGYGCPANSTIDPLTGACVPPPACPASWVQKTNGQCCPPPGASAAVGATVAAPACNCPAGGTFDGKKCVFGTQGPQAPPPFVPPTTVIKPTSCFPGFVPLPNGNCCRAGQVTASGQCCPLGQTPDANKRACVPIVQTPSIFVPGTRVVPGPIIIPQGPGLKTRTKRPIRVTPVIPPTIHVLPPPPIRKITPVRPKLTFPIRKLPPAPRRIKPFGAR